MSGKRKKVAENKSETIREIPLACADEASAVEFMEKQRWGEYPCCPRCGDMDVYQMKDRKTGQRSKRFLWRCRGCAKQFTVRIGTVFEDSRIPLRHWCYAFWRACTSKKGVAAKEIERQTGLSYKSALFMMHRIRFAMSEDGPFRPRMQGVIEADETWIGGKLRKKKEKIRRNKTFVLVMTERKTGETRAVPLERITSLDVSPELIRNTAVESSHLMTDEGGWYRRVGRRYLSHQAVKHGRYEYARGPVHINTAECFNGLLKRSINGIWHSVSKKHLHRYLAAATFRFSHRKMEDGERTAHAIRSAVGKRLYYKEPISA